MPESTEKFRAQREANLLRLLVRIFRHMNDETVARMRLRGVTEMQPAYPRLLGNLDTEGTRISALARKMGTTRQATGQLSKEIERAGFVTRREDPEDGRGVIIAFTPKGLAALRIAVEVIADVEKDYAELIGARKLRELKALIGQLLSKVDQQGVFGLD